MPAASVTCVHCHNPGRYIGDKLVVTTAYGDDENNPTTKSLVLVHVGGSDMAGHLSGIHGAHMGHIEYIATDKTNQTIPWVAKVNDDGSTTEFVSPDAKQPVTGQKRVMDCIDCHNRAAHSFDTPEKALNKAMTARSGRILLCPSCTRRAWLSSRPITPHRQTPTRRSPSGLEDFYRTQHADVWSQKQPQIEQAAKALSAIYDQNVFPYMKVIWGTHPNNHRA